MTLVNVQKIDVFEFLSMQKEVYAANCNGETLTNLYYMTIGEIHDMLSVDDYVFFIVKKEDDKKGE